MKIIGVDKNYYEYCSKFIVQCSYEEMRHITGTSQPLMVEVGKEIELCKKYEQALAVQRAASEALKVPNALRSVADCLELAGEHLKSILDGKKLDAVAEQQKAPDA